MSIKESAHVIPGIFCWYCLVGIFLVSGKWVNSIEKARQHPLLLSLLGLAILVSSLWMASGSDFPRASAFLRSVLATLVSSSIIVLVILFVAHVRIFEFTILERSFGLGMALVTVLPFIFLLVLVFWPVFLGLR